ncbi:lipase member H-like [Brevipalpus obovatus]|uniref:lipase member H-like n=1 Tax=Brevipalpus obovatus TaxID=246614 RepID=UPI003D9F000D
MQLKGIFDIFVFETLFLGAILASRLALTWTQEQNMDEYYESFDNAWIKVSLGPNKFEKDEVCYPQYGCFSNEKYFDPQSRPLVEVPASPRAVNLSYELFTSKNPKNSINFQFDDPDVLGTVSKVQFDPNAGTKFLIHGWGTKPLHFFWLWRLKDLLLHYEPSSNIFIVNWMKFVKSHTVQENVVTTELIGRMIARMIRELKIPPQNIHIFGNDMGAHIAGVIGTQFENPKIARITGLDPSRNFFDHDFRSIRLDYSQADYVDTVNTDSGFRGLGRNIGHINIFPNGGSNQIGCEESHWPKNLSKGAKYVKSVICDHSRAFLLMMENWSNGTIDCEPIAYACDSYGRYERGSCTECGDKNQHCELLGLEKLPGRELPSPDEDTSYYIQTSDKSPFCVHHYRVKIMTKNPKRLQGILNIGLLDLDENVSIDLERMRGKEDEIYSSLFVHQKPLMEINQALVSFNATKTSSTDELWIEKIHFKLMSTLSEEKKKKFSQILCPKNPEDFVTDRPITFVKCD